MNRLIFILDQYLRGPVAGVCAVVGTIWLGWLILGPLPWHRFPNVFAMVGPSWLYLIIICSIAYSGLMAVARRPGFPIDGFSCVLFGLVWKYTKILWFVPFNFSRWLIVYGLATLVAHCIRRSLAKPTASEPAVAPKLNSEIRT